MTHVKLPLETFNEMLTLIGQMPWHQANTLMQKVNATAKMVEETDEETPEETDEETPEETDEETDEE